MNILVTGATGQLGYDVCRVLSNRHITHRGVDLEDFDLTDCGAIHKYLKEFRPTAVIHCAAYTAVDKAEEDAANCFAVNADGTAHLAKAAANVGAKFLYVSTDYVFPGGGSSFYTPEDPVGPLSVYGRSKLFGEEAVRAALKEHFIVRTSWVFGKNGNNFVKTMLRLAKTRSELSVVCDQIGSPTYSYDLAELLCDMIVTDRYGIYHATNEGICSWAEFATEILKKAHSETVIHPIPATAYPSRAKRPYNSRLSKDKLSQNGFSRLPDWQDALCRYWKELDVSLL